MKYKSWITPAICLLVVCLLAGCVAALTNSQVSAVTKNVFDHFLAQDYPSEQVKSWDTQYYFIDRFNCDNLDHTGVLPSYTGPLWYQGVPTHNYFDWKADVTTLRLSDTCGVEGGSGLEMTVDPLKNNQLLPQVKPNWASVDVLYTRTYVDLTNLVVLEGQDLYLMKHRYTDGTVTNTVADLRIRMKNGNFEMRYFNTSPTAGAYVQVPNNRKFRLETMWSKPENKISLWVDGVRYDWAVNLSALAGLNRADLLLESLDPGMGGKLCVDEYALADRQIGVGLESKAVYLPLLVK